MRGLRFSSSSLVSAVDSLATLVAFGFLAAGLAAGFFDCTFADADLAAFETLLPPVVVRRVSVYEVDVLFIVAELAPAMRDEVPLPEERSKVTFTLALLFASVSIMSQSEQVLELP